MNRLLIKSIKYDPVYKPFWQLTAPPFALYLYAKLAFIEKTSTVKVQGLDELNCRKNSYIFTNWHEHLPYLCHHHGRHGGRSVIMSPAPYMASIALWCSMTGFEPVRPDKSEVAMAILSSKLRASTVNELSQLEQKESVCFAIDGPAGPAHVPKRGCIQLAQETGVPIVHVSYTTLKGKPDLTRWASGCGLYSVTKYLSSIQNLL
mmetsp:Transcript_4806/g.8036  ORF Transcript_4806/g.8036 Transcript_4806/m.8036 type:complete len:205 (+) Transcript_4806:146-760(+)